MFLPSRSHVRIVPGALVLIRREGLCYTSGMPFKNPDEMREYQRLWMARRRAEFFGDKACVKCGSDERLELDHIDPALKVSHRIFSWSESRRLAEIAKCQILCHDCHVQKCRDNNEHARGEANGMAKLTEAKIIQARELRAEGMSFRKIGEAVGVANTTIQDALAGITWKHLQ